MAQKVRSCGIITLGAVIYALAFDWFVAPNQIAMGGVTGLAQIVNALVAGPGRWECCPSLSMCRCFWRAGGSWEAAAGEQPVRHGSQFLGH